MLRTSLVASVVKVRMALEEVKSEEVVVAEEEESVMNILFEKAMTYYYVDYNLMKSVF
jgi:hypothetical protein